MTKLPLASRRRKYRFLDLEVSPFRFSLLEIGYRPEGNSEQNHAIKTHPPFFFLKPGTICSMANMSSKKTVSFASTARIKRILHLKEYSKEELVTTWYQTADFDRIRQEINETIDLMEEGTLLDESRYCKRGIEFHTREGSKLRRDNRSMSLCALLEEQSIQNDEGENDVEMMARVYSEYTCRCSIAAHMVALSDYEIVRARHDEQFHPTREKLSKDYETHAFIADIARQPKVVRLLQSAAA